jgi:hypothetical protein
MYYSPVRRCIGSKLPQPLDLHVLGLPPAFNLSHDQTLQFKIRCHPEGQLKTLLRIFKHKYITVCVFTSSDNLLIANHHPQVPTRIA